MNINNNAIINAQKIKDILKDQIEDEKAILEILSKAKTLRGLSIDEVAVLCAIENDQLTNELFKTAEFIKDEIYGKRLVVFAPLYISNLCANECTYCAFRAGNTFMKRKSLSQSEIARETEALINEGHKRLLLVSGESYPKEGFDYLLKSIETMYSVKTTRGSIRRINVNIAPLEGEEFKKLKESRIGTYQLFQETYHEETYKNVHLKGKKSDYNKRLNTIDLAMEAGIDDVGIGILFGLYDWHYEILALMQHIKHLENRFGFGPHTISVPRLEPADQSSVAENPPHPVSDIDFKKIVAILRLAVPYTGIIMSTRETAQMRRETFALGVSQISAGSKTNPGGYSNEDSHSSQFSLGDHRPLDEVIKDVMSMGYIPSFCTGCYRKGRTGEDFMDLAKPGLIKLHCQPNALLTLKEYLLDFGDNESISLGDKIIASEIEKIPEANRKEATIENIKKLKGGERDLYF